MGDDEGWNSGQVIGEAPLSQKTRAEVTEPEQFNIARCNAAGYIDPTAGTEGEGEIAGGGAQYGKENRHCFTGQRVVTRAGRRANVARMY